MSNFNPSFSKIGDILVHQKIISIEQLEQALSEQKNNNDKLGNILISQGVITEDDLVNAFSMQCGHRSITKEEMLKVVNFMDTILPKEKPRYLMGVGTPTDLVESILNGVDMFDCVIPTRNARNSQLFSFDGKINIRNAKYKNDFSPIDNNSFSLISNAYSKAYLHHLFKTNEVLGLRIATEHNLKFYIHLMAKVRQKIKDDCFEPWAKDFIKRYNNE